MPIQQQVLRALQDQQVHKEHKVPRVSLRVLRDPQELKELKVRKERKVPLQVLRERLAPKVYKDLQEHKVL